MEKRIGIITGASSGIGRSIALELAKTKNFNLILNGRNIDALKKLQQEVNEIAYSDVSEIVVGDVKEKLTLENCIDKCKDKWGSCPTLFVASAGRGLPGTLLTSNELEWKQLIDTNILGLMNQLKSISKNMIESISNGHNYITSPYDIVIIGSSIGRNVSPFNSVYGSTKFATHGLSEALRRELGPKGGQLTNKNDNSTSHPYAYVYDKLDRITSITGSEGVYSYDYVPLGSSGVNQIQKVTGPTYDYNYTYDALNRPKQKTDHIGSETFITTSEYDQYNNLSKYTYPNGFAILKSYDPHGYLSKITSDNGGAIWQTNNMNAVGKFTEYALGGLIVQKTFNDYGYPTNYFAQAGTGATVAQNYDFNFDPLTGNLTSRTDNTHGTPSLSETFTYDQADRLKTVSGSSSLTMDYSNNGNISTKSDVGTYSYDATKSNAVIGVTDPNNIISHNTQTVDYNAFNKAATIKELDINNNLALINELDYTYGPDQQRRKAVLKDVNGIINTTYYEDNYEKIISGANPNNFTETTYINGGDGLCAMYIKDQTGVGNLYYVLRDHLGSILKLTDGSGNTIAEQSFDAWGKPRDPNNWTGSPSASATPGLIRGYTGHEYLPQFSLINMNGRMYDPIIGRILSADNEVHNAENPQDYNRYSYCLNNPLKYIDPTGWDAQDEDDHERPDDDDDDGCVDCPVPGGVTVQTPTYGAMFKASGMEVLQTMSIQLSSDLNGPAFNGSIISNAQGQSSAQGKSNSGGGGGRDDDNDRDNEEDDDWDNLSKGLSVADFVGLVAAAGRDIAWDYRTSIPTISRVGMSANLQTITYLGMATKYLGYAGIAGGVLNTGIDISKWQSGQISGAQAVFNTAGTGSSIYIGATTVGTTAGALSGAAVGAGFAAWGMYINMFQQMQYVPVENSNNGITGGY